MKNIITSCFIYIGIIFIHLSCDSSSQPDSFHQGETKEESESASASMQSVFLSEYKFRNLDIRIDTVHQRVLEGGVSVNGELAVFPHHEASITPIMGGNLESIMVIEGDRVSKGQTIAFITHPEFTKLQSEYLRAYSQLEFIQQEFDRQKRLYEEEIGAGKSFQKIKSELDLLNVELKGYEAQLRQLNLDPEKILDEKIYDRVPVLSPITGYVEKIWVQLGQYVQSETPMMSVVNIDQVFADLKVFEKDISKVKIGQTALITLESQPEKEIQAKIFSIGKSFEKNSKAVHVHARIQSKEDHLLPGMYVRGRIQSSDGKHVMALPESAVIDEDGRSYIFTAQKSTNQEQPGWNFDPVEIRKGISLDDWIEIRPLTPLSRDARLVWDGAYYLISEMMKGEFEDD